MTKLQLKVIANAVKIRVERGEDPQTVIDSYTKLSKQEKEEILSTLNR